MNVKLKVLSAGALFFLGQAVFSQTTKRDTITKETQIEEVIMVGFGQKKTVSELTGAVGTIKSEAIENVPVASIDKLFQGRVAGVQTGNASGQPGGFATVRVRGISSVNGGVNPIYVVDGVRVASGDLTRGAITANVLANLNTEDIESMTVLKDAASTAVYGADAGSGVVIITTKSGKKGKPKVSANFEYGTNSRAIEGLRGLNTEQYRYLLSYTFANNPGALGETAPLTAEQFIANATNGKYGADLRNIYTTTNNTDWRDALSRTAFQQSINASISGGNDKVTYYNSANYFLQESEIKGSDFKRMGFTSKVNYDASEKLKFGSDVQLAYSKINTLNNGGAFSNPILTELFARPTDAAFNPDGSYNLGTGGRLSNNLFNNAYLADNNYYRSETARVFATVNADYKIIKNLNYRFVLGGEFINIENNTYLNPIHGDGFQVNGRKTESIERFFNWNLSNILSYNFVIGEKNNFDVRIIQEAYQRQNHAVGASGTSVGSPTLQGLTNFVKPASFFGDRGKSSRTGYAAVLNYNFDKIFTIDASYRRDALSNFQPGQKWGDFYSVGVAVDLARINFVRDIDQISLFKLRTSYGLVGNQISSTPYSLLGFTTNYNDLAAVTYSGVNNPNLKWEVIKPLSFGIDGGLFNNRITFTAEYYHKETTDLVFSQPLSLAQGLSAYDKNIGTLVNKGFEFAVNGDIIRNNDLIWSLGGNFSTLNNEITKLYGGQDIIQGSTILREGEGVGTFYMRKWAGVDPSNGNALWYINGIDGETTSNYNAAQLAVQGSNFAKKYGGINTRIIYKGFSLDALATFGFGGKVLNDWANYTSSDGQYTFSFPGSTDALDFWTPSNPNAANPKPIYNNTTLSNRVSSRFLSKTDYFRLSNIKIGYRFTAEKLRGSGLSGFEVYVQGNNIWTHLYDDTLRFDPENNLTTTNNLNLPVQKTYSLGLNLQF
ncbi:SusC/RagA family TonB-linked outer membrane protein [Chryseobacterium sp. Leaf180]|uniref:SusC/RagA family TonB-linked outer membrane protein n=1 Tax=Chryseobacterium sp. Leaf180 TaxID=1736289 RepID=UPI0006F34058|nr:SusC/RagA family TonB-linked outer membrane protein [Chryseobacterium sp. Leaf180]KQR95503.1 SusC/RagA family TonB-linked outer membrane protein [Chryseobacterium sp. Leaf180]